MSGSKNHAGGIILAAVILGLIVAGLLWNIERKRDMLAKQNWVPVVVAVQDIPAHSKITREMVELVTRPKEAIVTGEIVNPEQVEGRFTLRPIREKDQIRSTDLVGEGQKNALVFEIPNGMRAIAIQAGEVIAVGTSVKPGDRVDILATYTDPAARQQTTQMILQNVLVLAVNRGDTDAQSKGGANSSMTLAVKPEEAELLTAADRAGALRVALRGAQDKTILDTVGVGARDFPGRRTFAMATQPPDAGRATPIIINPLLGSGDNQIKIYRGAVAQTVSVN